MDQQKPVNRLKKLRSNYRLVIMNDDSFEEVAKFRLTRLSVYIAISTVFIALVLFTSLLIAFTPLKYYLPDVGYGNVKQLREFNALKLRTDSMETALQHQQVYLDHLNKTLEGKIITTDTTLLNVPGTNLIDIAPEPDVDKKTNKKNVRKGKKKNR